MQTNDDLDEHGLNPVAAFLAKARSHIHGRGPVVAGVSMVVLAAVLGSVLWASYPAKNSAEDGGSGAAPLIRAQATPYRVAPEEPGGMTIPYRDSTVFDAIHTDNADRPGGKAPAGGVENLMPQAEQPLPRGQLFAGLKPDAKAPAAVQEPEPVTVPIRKAADKKEETKPSGLQQKPAPEIIDKTDDEQGEKPMNVQDVLNGAADKAAAAKTVVVDKAVAVKNAAGDKIAAVKQATDERITAVKDDVKAGAAKVEDMSASAASAVAEKAAAAKDATTTAIHDKTDAMKTAVADTAQKVAAIRPAPITQQAITDLPEAQMDEAAGGGSYSVQLGAVRSEAEAQETWRAAQSANPELAALTLNVQKADVPGKGTFYRVRGGGVSAAQAQSICHAVAARKPGGCIVIKP